MSSKAPGSPLERAGKLLLITFLLLAVWPVRAGARQVVQSSAPPGSMGRSPTPGSNPNEPNPLAGSTALKMEHMREDDRRKRMLADTAKLVALSTELNAEVEKTPKDELSVDVVRKAAEIEKLAHDVKDRMRS